MQFAEMHVNFMARDLGICLQLLLMTQIPRDNNTGEMDGRARFSTIRHGEDTPHAPVSLVAVNVLV